MALIRRESFGRWTRLGLSLELALLVVLSLAATLLVVWLAQWRPVRWRADLSRAGQNTLDPQTVRVIEQLPRDVEIDVFFSPVAGQVGPALAEIQQRTMEVLFLLRETAGERIEIRVLPADRPAVREQRARELDVTRDNVVVVSSGARRVQLRAEVDLASIAMGDPRTGQPPSMVDFRAEEALVEALGRIASDSAPRVLFSVAFGESDAQSLEPLAMGLLWRALEDEGFEVATWDADAADEVPADADVLALIGGEQPLTETALAAVQAFVARGGSLFVALGQAFLEGPGSPVELLAPYGLRPTRGLVCSPLLDPRTGRMIDGVVEVSALVLGPELLSSTHPVTQPLAERGRRLRGALLRSFERVRAPADGAVLSLVASPDDAWRDLATADGAPPDFRFEPEREEQGRFLLAAASEFRTSPSAATRARVIAVGGLDFVANRNHETNRDFALNAFNWLASRDFRVRVARRDPFEARIDVERGRERTWATRLALWILPGLAAAAGVAVFVARRR